MLAAIRAGMDRQLAAAETRRIQAELQDAGAAIENWQRSTEYVAPLTEAEIRAAIGGAGDLVNLLDQAERADRA